VTPTLKIFPLSPRERAGVRGSPQTPAPAMSPFTDAHSVYAVRPGIGRGSGRDPPVYPPGL
jgi:hypothetical protein